MPHDPSMILGDSLKSIRNTADEEQSSVGDSNHFNLANCSLKASALVQRTLEGNFITILYFLAK